MERNGETRALGPYFSEAESSGSVDSPYTDMSWLGLIRYFSPVAYLA